VLIDIALPGMDGFELLEAIRSNENWSHLPCIAFTAYHSSLVKQRGGSRVRRLILQAT
jgi:CheY-like chemotaxis protein